MKCSLNPTRHEAGAIRPLDVAAIICVIGTLAFLATLTIRYGRERALRIRCQQNLSAIGKAFEGYTRENNGSMPDCTGADPRYAVHDWPWDLDTNLFTELKGVNRETFYCPANPAMNDERHWNFPKVSGAPVRVAGYGMLLQGTRFVPPDLWVTKMESANAKSPSKTELSFDATASLDEDFTRIQGLWTDRSNHMRDRQPLGGNILFADTHVAWRGFSQMQIRFQTIGPGGIIDWSY
jgi:prepilin-type processing-associated H-X9-DG protein